MLAIKTAIENMGQGVFIGQMGEAVVLEVESTPSFAHEDITDTDIKFIQRTFPGVYGEAVTYQQLIHIRSLLTELGDEAVGAQSVAELAYRKQQRDYFTALELALVDLYEGSL